MPERRKTHGLILAMRATIRTHRDMKGDDRCWLDDKFVWVHLEDSPPDAAELPSFEDGMARCRAFYEYRRADAPDPIAPEAILDPNRWDDDLGAMDDGRLAYEAERIRAAIRAHRDIGDRPRTIDDDRALYAILPEKLPADFRLPPEDEFLGEAKSPCAGCPAFWRSHAACPSKTHNPHAWGPCPS